MRKYGAILLYLLLLAEATVGAFRWADALQRSVFTYQSPLAGIQIAPGEPMPSQTRRVVLVLSVAWATMRLAWSTCLISKHCSRPAPRHRW